MAEFKNPLNFELMSGNFELNLIKKHIKQACTVTKFKNSLNFELISCHFELNLLNLKLPYSFRIHQVHFKLTW